MPDSRKGSQVYNSHLFSVVTGMEETADMVVAIVNDYAALAASHQDLVEAIEALVEHSNGCTCCFPSDTCCPIARARVSLAEAEKLTK